LAEEHIDAESAGGMVELLESMGSIIADSVGEK